MISLLLYWGIFHPEGHWSQDPEDINLQCGTQVWKVPSGGFFCGCCPHEEQPLCLPGIDSLDTEKQEVVFDEMKQSPSSIIMSTRLWNVKDGSRHQGKKVKWQSDARFSALDILGFTVSVAKRIVSLSGLLFQPSQCTHIWMWQNKNRTTLQCCHSMLKRSLILWMSMCIQCKGSIGPGYVQPATGSTPHIKLGNPLWK